MLERRTRTELCCMTHTWGAGNDDGPGSRAAVLAALMSASAGEASKGTSSRIVTALEEKPGARASAATAYMIVANAAMGLA